MEAIYKLILKAGSLPWVIHCIAILIILSLILIFFLIFQRIRKGDDFKFFWFIQLKSSRIVEALRRDLSNLNEDAKQKTQVIKTLNQVSLEIANVMCSESQEEYQSNKKAVFDFILYSIGSVLTKQKSNNHRVAIFTNNGDGNLKIYEGFGFSSEGKRELRLNIDNSSAGHTYRTAEPYISGDVSSPGNSYKRHPKATKTIKSLMCVPIKCDKITLGVLSIDGQEGNSFTKDDLDYLKYFADALTPLMLIEYIDKQKEEGESNGQTGDQRSSKQLA